MFFWHHRSTKHRKYRCFWHLRSQKTRYLRCFLPLGEKTRYLVFTVLCGLRLANTGIYTVFSLLQEVVFPCKSCKHTVNYSVLDVGADQKNNKHHLENWKTFPLQCLTPMRLFLTDSRCKITRTTPKPPTRSPCCTLGSADIYLYVELCRTV